MKRISAYKIVNCSAITEKMIDIYTDFAWQSLLDHELAVHDRDLHSLRSAVFIIS